MQKSIIGTVQIVQAVWHSAKLYAKHVDNSPKNRSMLFQIRWDSLTLIPQNKRVTNQDQKPASTVFRKVQNLNPSAALQAYLGYVAPIGPKWLINAILRGFAFIT